MLLYTQEEFKSYCNAQLKSIGVAIDRKVNGSPVEEPYFLEHLEKLKKFFCDSDIKIK